MKPERRKLYPKNWKALANACREEAGLQCQHCGVTQGEERISRRTRQVYTVSLHAAHRNHDVDNPKPELLCLCPSCHGRYDYEHLQQSDQVKFEQLKHKLVTIRR